MTIIEQARKIRADMNAVTATLTDEQGLELITLFEPWRTDLTRTIKKGRKNNGLERIYCAGCFYTG